jgi:geranylgeranyl diphosphate synthase type II
MTIEQYLVDKKYRVEAKLGEILLNGENASRLERAMYYAVMNGGKRLRPILAYAAAEALGAEADCADIAACSIECIHAYSLIHDDLPAMDDDNLRRGKPTCHIQFDEATAILAGDALQSLAFELLCDARQQQITENLQLRMLQVLTKAVGRHGMVAGQSIDFYGTGLTITEEDLAIMHELKTGALISASIMLGAMSTGKADILELDCLGEYAKALGLAYQVKDDILDVEGDTAVIGKQHGKDEALGKITYPTLLGIEGARDKAISLCDKAISVLDIFGSSADPLRELASYVIKRNF